VAVRVEVGVPPVAVAVGVGVAVLVAVALAVGVAVAVGLGSGVPLPSPLILILSAFLLAPFAIVSFADFLPSDDAVKMIDTAQLPSAGKLPTQFTDGANSAFVDATELTSMAIEFGL
jgi:hypothetical protein